MNKLISENKTLQHPSLFNMIPGKDEKHSDSKKKLKLKKIKSSILKYMIGLSLILLIVVLERVFFDFLRGYENSLIIYFQKKFNIVNQYDRSNFYNFISQISDIRFFFLLNTHIYIILYFGFDSFLAIKILMVHYFGVFLCYVLQIIYKAPRPFWTDSNIIKYSCDGDFLMPNDFFFSYIFIFIYIFYNFRAKKKNLEVPEINLDSIKEMREENNSFFKSMNHDSIVSSEDTQINENKTFIQKIQYHYLKFVKGILVILFFVLVFLRYLIGVVYLEAIFITIVYCLFYYFICVFMDGYIEDFIKRSTIVITEAKRYVFKWLIAIILMECFAYISYIASLSYSPIEWVENYLNCPYIGDLEKKEVGSKALGYWYSFVSTTILFGLVGFIFGVLKSYRLMNNILWCETSVKHRIIRVIIASLFLIPSWTYSIFFKDLVNKLDLHVVFFNEYLLHGIHFFFLYYILFGLTPFYVFKKLKLTNEKIGYFVINDREMI